LINNTVGNKIKTQDTEAYQTLMSILKEPHLYTGRSRFDYVDFLFQGYCKGRKINIDFLPDSELQYWLLHTQSASIHSLELNGRALFYRCFGLGSFAFVNYISFLGTPLPLSLGSWVSEAIYWYEQRYKLVRHDCEDDAPPDCSQKTAQSVRLIIQEMISQTGTLHDDIIIYIRKECLFTQVRFMFYVNNEWKDDTQIISKPEYHGHLIAIHAYARNSSVDNLRNLGYQVFGNTDYDDSALPLHDSLINKTTLSQHFTHWKYSLLDSYGVI